ncbi:hypothetical protein NQ314_009247 [Rhamnusium bicolor]|uniref:BPTI/Kunitz inhibitor domain-containing protein n=1 Tax=Rhamnusium bicolor TaxID=1586634 RepID=A0AAV8Y3Q8_9CUCU|nr:hypothetical protein NQ314_009247 [Rhamnusium bicolor]
MMVCMQDSEPGPCQGYFNRWYFESSKLMCLPFVFGGCRGNRNNFLTAEECNEACGVVRGKLLALYTLENNVISIGHS